MQTLLSLRTRTYYHMVANRYVLSYCFIIMYFALKKYNGCIQSRLYQFVFVIPNWYYINYAVAVL